jgi:hypothetical protein
MWAVAVVVDDVVGQYVLKMTVPEDQYPIQTLATHRADKALGEGDGPWSPDWGGDDPNALRPEDFVEARSELGVSVSEALLH